MNKFFKQLKYAILIFIGIIMFLLLVQGCKYIGSPDIRDEYGQDKKFDYFGWKWSWNW